MRNAINQADGLHAEALFSQTNHGAAVYVIIATALYVIRFCGMYLIPRIICNQAD